VKKVTPASPLGIQSHEGCLFGVLENHERTLCPLSDEHLKERNLVWNKICKLRMRYIGHSNFDNLSHEFLVNLESSVDFQISFRTGYGGW